MLVCASFMSFMCMGVEKFSFQDFLTRFLQMLFFQPNEREKCLRQLFCENSSYGFHSIVDQLRDVFYTFLNRHCVSWENSHLLLKNLFSIHWCVSLKPKDIMTFLSAIFLSHMFYFYLFFIYSFPFFARRLRFHKYLI